MSTDAESMILAPLPGHAHTIYSAIFSNDGRYLATVGADNAVRVWDVTDRRHPMLVARLSNDVSAPTAVTFNENGSVLYTLRRNGSIDKYATEGIVLETWRETLKDGTRFVWANPDPGGDSVLRSLPDGTHPSWSVSTSDPERHLVVTGSKSNGEGNARVSLLDTNSSNTKEASSIPGLDTVTALALSKSASLLAVGTEGGSASIYRINDWSKPENVSGACVICNMEDYSKPHVIEKKNSPRAASYASRYVLYGRR